MLFAICLFSTNSQCISCADASRSQVTTQSQVGEKSPPETNCFIVSKTVYSFCASTKISPDSARCLSCSPLWLLAELNQSDRHAGTYMWSSYDLMLSEECVMRGVSSLWFKGCPCDTWCQAVTRLADYTLDAWKSARRVSGKGVLCSPLQPWHQQFGLVLLLNQTDSDKQKEGWGGFRLYIQAASMSECWQEQGRGI